MSLDAPKSEDEEVKSNLLTEERVDQRNHGVSDALTMEARKKSDNLNVNDAFRSAPLATPVRPLSPDTMSIMSAEEYEQLRPSTQDHELSNQSLLLGSRYSGWLGKLVEFWIRNKGLLYVLLSQAFGALMNVTVRLLEIEGNKGRGLHPFHILFARMGGTLFLSTVYMWWRKTPDFPLGIPEIRWLLVARGLAGFCGVFGMYYSLLYLPLADATVITFLAPGLACWACSILLKEPFTRVEQFGGLVSLLGVVLIARPVTLFAGVSDTGASTGATGDTAPSTNSTTPSSSDPSNYDSVTPTQRMTAVGVSLIGVLGSAIVYTVIRWIGKRAHPLITVNYFAAWVTFVSIVAQAVMPGVGWLLPADIKEWCYLVFLGICGFIMQFLLAAGLAYEKSSRATNMCYTSMFFALFFDKIIFDHTPAIMSILGSSLIIGSAITIALQKDAPKAQQRVSTEAVRRDLESRTGLISGARDIETGEDHDRIQLEEVQLRSWRKARGARANR